MLKWLGVMPRREGFDPGIFESPAAWWAATVFRFPAGRGGGCFGGGVALAGIPDALRVEAGWKLLENSVRDLFVEEFCDRGDSGDVDSSAAGLCGGFGVGLADVYRGGEDEEFDGLCGDARGGEFPDGMVCLGI